KIEVRHATDPADFQPYARDQRLVRPWAIPGTPGLEHRIGGLEKRHLTGQAAYGPDHPQWLVQLRQATVDRVAEVIPPIEPFGDPAGELLVVGWGGTFGAIRTAVDHARQQGKRVSAAHLRHLNPLPKNLGEVLRRFKRVLIPELNSGQLRLLIRGRFLVDARGLNKVQGRPFLIEEIEQAIDLMLADQWGEAESRVPQGHELVPADHLPSLTGGGNNGDGEG